jgi:hypothetical protein
MHRWLRISLVDTLNHCLQLQELVSRRAAPGVKITLDLSFNYLTGEHLPFLFKLLEQHPAVNINAADNELDSHDLESFVGKEGTDPRYIR